MHLLYDREIPEKYKKRALDSWFTIAAQEEQGKARPREEHERATTKMAELLQTWVHGDMVEGDTHTAIVRFLEACKLAGQPYIQDFIVSRVGNYIADENVRFSFAWRHVLSEAAQFTIRTEEDRAFVGWAGAAARERGLGFAGRADALIREYEANRRTS